MSHLIASARKRLTPRDAPVSATKRSSGRNTFDGGEAAELRSGASATVGSDHASESRIATADDVNSAENNDAGVSDVYCTFLLEGHRAGMALYDAGTGVLSCASTYCEPGDVSIIAETLRRQIVKPTLVVLSSTVDEETRQELSRAVGGADACGNGLSNVPITVVKVRASCYDGFDVFTTTMPNFSITHIGPRSIVLLNAACYIWHRYCAATTCCSASP